MSLFRCGRQVVMPALIALVLSISQVIHAAKLPVIDSVHQTVKVEETLSAKNATELLRHFDRLGLNRKTVLSSGQVPALYVDKVPNDFNKMAVKEFERAFIFMILVNVANVNRVIGAERQALLSLADKSALSADEQQWLAALSARYYVKDQNISELLLRVDMIPASLAIAQSVVESAWGKSHFAIEGNALFGQHLAHNSKGRFIQASGANVKMAAFDTVLEAVNSYMHNLNTTHAYQQLRQIRADERTANKPISGIALSEALLHYSERGSTYVHTLQSIMKHHKLADYDALPLGGKPTAILIKQ